MPSVHNTSAPRPHAFPYHETEFTNAVAVLAEVEAALANATAAMAAADLALARADLALVKIEIAVVSPDGSVQYFDRGSARLSAVPDARRLVSR